MRMHHDFKASRRVAVHCAELLARGVDTRSPLDGCDSLGTSIANQLAKTFGALCGFQSSVTHSAAETLSITQLAKSMGSQFVHSVVTLGQDSLPMLASFDSAAAFLLLDQAFGGNGAMPDTLPSPLPASAILMVAQVQSEVTRALSLAFACPATQNNLQKRLDKASPFASRATLATMLFGLRLTAGREWHLRLTMEQANIPDLLNMIASDSSNSDEEVGQNTAFHPCRAPFASIPLNLRAVLVDAEISIARLSQLSPGEVLPISVARNVPLCVDRVEIGRGQVGTLDDHAALKINSLMTHQRNS